jgi:hypothetical protein
MLDMIYEDGLPALAFILTMAFACIGIGAMLFDGIQGVRSERATIACKAQQMDAIRLTFTTDVICVPYATRRDTVAVEAVR